MATIKEETKDRLRDRLEDYLRYMGVDIGSNGEKNFSCLDPNHNDKHPSMSVDKKNKQAHCFACGARYDIFDLIGLHEGITDFVKQVERAGELFGVEVWEKTTAQEAHSTASRSASPVAQNQPRSEQHTHTDMNIHTDTYTHEDTAPEVDYTDFFLQANKDIEKTGYHRGLSLETLNRFKVGFVENWKHPKMTYKPESPRLIIPTSRYSYIARDTRSDIPEEQEEDKKLKVGKVRIFNRKRLPEATKPIYVVEGEIDALSIIEVGGEAVGVGSISYVNIFLEELKKNRPAQPLILALDKEEDPEKRERVERAEEKIITGLKAQGIEYYAYNPTGKYKDANEALMADRETFTKAVQRGEDPDIIEKEEYYQNTAYNHLQGFIDGITESVNTPAQPTGFTALDNALDGGLYEGLYIIGAITSLGKTTLALQIADQIADSGREVLIFSLEMARDELMSKSISRLTLLEVLENNGSPSNAKTARGITAGARYERYSQTELELIDKAIKSYKEYAGNIVIHEGVGDIGITQIREIAKKGATLAKKAGKQPPVILVDYIQILAPHDVRATDKQNMDKAVLELKRISRDYKTPVIGISSFNRSNYNNEVAYDAFKESGAIEYGSDVLIGLQLKGAGAKGFDSTEAKRKNPREIELVILKQRNGKTGEKVDFSYYPLFNYFKER